MRNIINYSPGLRLMRRVVNMSLAKIFSLCNGSTCLHASRSKYNFYHGVCWPGAASVASKESERV